MKTTDTPKTESAILRINACDADCPDAVTTELVHPAACREIEIQRNELLACMDFLRDVITDEQIEEAIEDVGWNHENGTPIQWVDWCLKRVRGNSLENVQSVPPADKKTPPKPQDD